jgi:hypothetical protein
MYAYNSFSCASGIVFLLCLVRKTTWYNKRVLMFRRSLTYGYENPALRAVCQIEPISDQYYPIHFPLLLAIQTLPLIFCLLQR